ncbi:hypothetical protein BIW11_13416 [Tropilaelaps mercedesae]|uniref:Chitin-binding type-2 domain-containing protein n=1 Tax=Tropilaelaps mercedesae TaxID=418985 RepID=A0A1V9X2X1_9ACAR|nr:hypothetical protein BIW11_13416 [Tropilaelaps mercedesae]
MLIDVRTPLAVTAALVAAAEAATLSRQALNVAAHSASARAPDDDLGTGESPMSFQLPAGAELVLGGNVLTTFSCNDAEHQKYGYYADVDNNCQVFHVCNPVQMSSSNPQHLQLNPGVSVLQYSFYCGNGTVFDQLSMTCAFEDDAIPCGNSPDFYYLNDNLGIEDAPLLTDDDISRKAALIEAARGQQPNQVEITASRPPIDEMSTPPAEAGTDTTQPPPVRAQTPPFGKRQPQQKTKHQQQQKRPSQQQTKYTSDTRTSQHTHDAANNATKPQSSVTPPPMRF